MNNQFPQKSGMKYPPSRLEQELYRRQWHWQNPSLGSLSHFLACRIPYSVFWFIATQSNALLVHNVRPPCESWRGSSLQYWYFSVCFFNSIISCCTQFFLLDLHLHGFWKKLLNVGIFLSLYFLIRLGSSTLYAGSEDAQLAVHPGTVDLIPLQAHMSYLILSCRSQPLWKVLLNLCRICCCCSKLKHNSVAWVCKRIIPTERPPLVGEGSVNLCG
jgi:hypothetical protein